MRFGFPTISFPVIRSRGVTLMELMVVILIMGLLIAITVPAIAHFKTKAKAAAQQQQLAGLRDALGAYYNDFNVYPPSNNPADPTSDMIFNTASNKILHGRGGAMLAEGLMGYLPAAGDGAGPPNTGDPAYGFRVKGAGINATGQIHGPYGSDDSKYLVNNPSPPLANADKSFVDMYGNEILYFRSTRAVNDRSGMNAVTQVFGTDLSNAGNNFYFYADDNVLAPDGTARTSPANSSAFLKLLGASANSLGTSAANITGADSFLLISPGPDGVPFTSDDVVLGRQ